MRHDLLTDKKSLHVKMDKSIHLAFRAKLFKVNLSMQEVIEEFTRLYIADDPRMDRIVQQLSERKLKEYIEGITPRKKRRQEVEFSELDHDTLYDLISRANDEKET